MIHIIETIQDLKEILNSNTICDNGEVRLQNESEDDIIIGCIDAISIQSKGWFHPVMIFEIRSNEHTTSKFETLKELKEFLNSTTEYDNLCPCVQDDWKNKDNDTEIFELTCVKTGIELGGVPCTYLVGTPEVVPKYILKSRYCQIDKSYWDECSHVFDENGNWSPNGIYNAEGLTRDEVDY